MKFGETHSSHSDEVADPLAQGVAVRDNHISDGTLSDIPMERNLVQEREIPSQIQLVNTS